MHLAEISHITTDLDSSKPKIEILQILHFRRGYASAFAASRLYEGSVVETRPALKIELMRPTCCSYGDRLP